jgi:hypothetical protein
VERLVALAARRVAAVLGVLVCSAMRSLPEAKEVRSNLVR